MKRYLTAFVPIEPKRTAGGFRSARQFLSCAVLLLFCLPGHLSAQNSGSIHGYVTDAGTGETLISASVGIAGTRKGASTNTSGYYSITDLDQGTVTVVASYIGYRRFEREVEVDTNGAVRLDIALHPEDFSLEELVVESEAEKEELKNIGVVQLKTELVNRVPSVFESDVFRALQLLPGVKAASDFSSGLYIRGGSPDHTLILLDGTTVYNPSHFFGFFSTFNPDAIKDVRLYKGGYPAEFGGRLGSVLTVYNRDGNRNEFGGTATLGMLASRLSMEGPLPEGSWMVAARRSTLEPLLAILRQTEENIPTGFHFFDFNGKVSHHPDDDNRFSLAFYAGNDNLSFPFSDDASIRLNYGNQTVSSRWTHIFSDRVFGNFTVTGSRYFNFPSFQIATTPYERNNNIYDFSVKGDLEYLPSDRHAWSAGFWTGIMTLKVRDTFDGEGTFSSRIQSTYTSLYLQDIWSVSDRWDLTGGLRLNGFSEGGYSRLEPRISTEFRPVPEIRLQAAYGRYNQFLTLISNEAFTGFDTWLTTNRGVPPAYGDQFVLGVKTAPWEGYGVDVELYYRTMRDLFELDPFLPDAAGLEYADLFRFGRGYAYGIELFLERQVGRLTGFAGYTWSVTARRFPGYNEPLVQEGSARYYPPKYDRRHDLNLVLNYRFNRRWSASAVFNYATGQAYTRPLGRAIALSFPTSSNEYHQLVVGRVNASRLPPYHRLDLGVERSGTFFGKGDATWQFQIINVYSRRNVWFYSYDFNENPAARSEIPLLPLLPTVSYTLEF